MAGRIPELDGIRGLAILLVLVWHYIYNSIQDAAPHSWQAYSLATIRLTWSGVDLFFVLSGFLIGGILYDAKNSKNYYQTFYSRRIYRIFPLYFLWIALFLAGLYFTGPSSASSLRAIFNRDVPVWLYPLFLQNFSMASQQIFGSVWLGVTWSLAVEEQFYLLLPLFVRHFEYRGIVWLAVASIVCAPVFRLILWLSGNEIYGPYTLLPCRADALGFGVLAALACRDQRTWEWLASHRRHLYGALLVLGLGFAYLLKNERLVYVTGLTWIAAFYAVLLLLVVVNPGRIETACFRLPVLVKLGTVAYSVYIFHLGINALFHLAVFGRPPGIRDWASFSVTLLSLTAVMVLSALSWRLLEKPLIRRAHAVHHY